MHQNSPIAIANLKNFPGRNPGTPVSEGGRYTAGGEGTGWEVGRGEGGRGRLEAPL